MDDKLQRVLNEVTASKQNYEQAVIEVLTAVLAATQVGDAFAVGVGFGFPKTMVVVTKEPASGVKCLTISTPEGWLTITTTGSHITPQFKGWGNPAPQRVQDIFLAELVHTAPRLIAQLETRASQRRMDEMGPSVVFFSHQVLSVVPVGPIGTVNGIEYRAVRAWAVPRNSDQPPTSAPAVVRVGTPATLTAITPAPDGYRWADLADPTEADLRAFLDASPEFRKLEAAAAPPVEDVSNRRGPCVRGPKPGEYQEHGGTSSVRSEDLQLN